MTVHIVFLLCVSMSKADKKRIKNSPFESSWLTENLLYAVSLNSDLNIQ